MPQFTKEDRALAERIIPNWKTMIGSLPEMDERQVYKLLLWELANRRSKYMLRRLHQRWTRLRAERERVRLLEHWEAP
jgi:hypothetical protein